MKAVTFCRVALFLSASLFRVPAEAQNVPVAAVRRTALRNNEFSPVRLRGVVTAFSGWKTSFFLQDSTGGVSIDRHDQTQVQVGDEVEINGTVHPGFFAPVVVSDQVSVLGHSAPPVPLSSSYEEIARGQLDSRWIEVRGVVRAARVQQIWGRRILLLDLKMAGGAVQVNVLAYPDRNFDYLVDSVVRMDGVCGTIFNDRRQLIGIRLFVPDMNGIQVEEPAVAVSQIPLSPIPSLMAFNAAVTDHRVKISGTVTYRNPGNSLYIEDGGAAVLVQTSQSDTFEIGSRVEAAGFVSSSSYSPELKDSVVRKTGAGKPPPPVVTSAEKVIAHDKGFNFAPYDGLLVELEAQVVERPPPVRNQTWLLRSGPLVFQARLREPSDAGNSGIDPGTKVKVTGICVAELDEENNPTSFHILVRSNADLVVLQTPYWTVSRLFLLGAFSLSLSLGLLSWAFQHRRSYDARALAGEENSAILSARFQRAAVAFAALASVVGLLVLAGWLFGIDVLKHIRPQYAAMAPNSALTFVLAGAFFWYRHFIKQANKAFERTCAAAVVAVGALTLLEYLTHLNLYLDRALLSARLEHLNHSDPDRMAFVSALSFLLLGGALWLIRMERFVQAAQAFAATVGVICLLNLIAYFYGIENSHGVTVYTVMAIHTALCFLLLSVAVLFCRAESGLMKPISSSALGGFMARRLLLAALLIPAGLGWIHWQGLLHGYYDNTFGLAMLLSANIVAFGFLIWTNAPLLNRLDMERSKTQLELREEQQFRALLESAPDAMLIVDMEGKIVLVNAQTEAVFGYSRNELLGEAIEKLIPSHARVRHVDAREQYSGSPHSRQMGSLEMELNGLRKDGSEFPVEISLSPIASIKGQQIAAAVRDATTRRTMERQLREGEERYRNLVESLPQLVWTSLPDGRCDYLSRKWVEYTGVPESEQLGFRWLEQIHPEDRSSLQNIWRNQPNAAMQLDAECRMLSASGEYRWFRMLAVPVHDSNEAIAKWFGTCTDIHNIKLAEDALMESRANFRQLADAMPQIVWTAKPDGSVDYCNQRWSDYTDMYLAQAKDWGWRSAVHPEDLPPFEAYWKVCLATGESFESEVRLRRSSDGAYRWHLGRAIPVRNAEGAIVRWFGTHTDIEDYKRVQLEIHALNSSLERRVRERSAELAESEQRFRLLVEGVKDYAILMLDCDGRIVSWNTGAESIKGYSAQEIIGQHFSIFYPEDDPRRECRGKELETAIREGQFQEEGRRIRKDGTPFWASVSITPVYDEAGELHGFSNITRDITERKKAAEEILAACVRAEEANRAKSAFLAAMSHEIRTPMNAILGMTDLLTERNLDPVSRDYVERCRRAGSNLLTLINDILDLSKIESGRFELEFAQFDLEELVERTVEMISPKAQLKGINLVSRVMPGTPTNLIGDSARLQQVLINLLGNAAKFTERGEIALIVSPVEGQASQRVRFEVTDTGIGIPPEKLEAIFEDFTQAESSTTRRFGGTGLGLGIARRLVNRMGGVLKVTSVVGKGSQFTFEADFQISAQPAPSKPEKGRTHDLAGKLVLIVDNNATNRLILTKMCAAWGMLPREAASAAEAIEIVRSSIREQAPFSVVILDLQMPDANGFDALQRIREMNPDLPVVIITSDDQTGDATKARTLGASAFAVRPLRQFELLRIVSALIRQEPAQSPLGRGEAAQEMKILVAEDSEDNRFLLEVYLKDGGYKLTFVENGQEAVDAFARDQFDLVLMDVQMPVMDGLEATRSIRALERRNGSKPTVILALTANALIEDAERSQAAGCNGHLSKPISREKLIGAVKNSRSIAHDIHNSEPVLEPVL